MAVSIIAHPTRTTERFTALSGAAGLPELFAELDGRFQNGKASDQALRSYLLTQKFIPSAADAAIRSYRETKQFVELEKVDYDAEQTKAEIMEESHRSDWEGMSGPAERRPAASLEGYVLKDEEPYQLTLRPRSGLEFRGRLRTVSEVEEFIEALNACKILLRPADSFKKPEDGNEGN